jgi:hypothetical protein
MCKKMKAFYYLPNYQAEFCLGTYANQYLFSELDETQLWCSPERFSLLLGLSNAVILKALSVVFITSAAILLG